MGRELIPEVKLNEDEPVKKAEDKPQQPQAAPTPQERNLEYFMEQMRKRVNAEFEEKKAAKQVEARPVLKDDPIFSNESWRCWSQR